MQEHDRAVVGTGHQFVKSGLPRRLCILFPVHIGETPENGFVAQFLRPGKVFIAEFAFGRSIEKRQGRSCRFLEQRGKIIQLFFERGFIFLGHVRVVIGVVAHRMAFGDHPLDQVRVFLDIAAYYKEGAGGVVLFQRVKNGRGIAVLIPCIERQIQPFLLRVSAVKSIEGAQLFG